MSHSVNRSVSQGGVKINVYFIYATELVFHQIVRESASFVELSVSVISNSFILLYMKVLLQFYTTVYDCPFTCDDVCI